VSGSLTRTPQPSRLIIDPKDLTFVNITSHERRWKKVGLKYPGPDSDGLIVIKEGQLAGDPAFESDFGPPVACELGQRGTIQVSCRPEETGNKDRLSVGYIVHRNTAALQHHIKDDAAETGLTVEAREATPGH